MAFRSGYDWRAAETRLKAFPQIRAGPCRGSPPPGRPPPHPPPLPVPLGVAIFPRDPGQPVRRFAERGFPNIVQWTEFDRGGHFAAMEQPNLLVGDLRSFVATLRS